MYSTSITLHLVICCVGSNFKENPKNVTCILGAEFTISCQLPVGALSGKWIYNGREITRENTLAGLKVANVSDRYMLGMNCAKERHYATVQCEASVDIFTDRSERSFTSIIKVKGL